MSASWVTFAFELANFLVLAFALGWLFFRPVRAALERRRSEIEAERRSAEKAHQQAESELSQAAARRAELEARLDELRERLRREAEVEKQALLESARAQIERERERSEQELLGLRRAQARESARDAAYAAGEIVRALLGRLKGPELEELLLAAACRELEALRAGGRLAPLVIESAAPLAAATRARLLAAAGSAGAETSERMVPDLIAGLRVVTVRGLVDLSVAGAASRIEQLLAGRIEAGNRG